MICCQKHCYTIFNTSIGNFTNTFINNVTCFFSSFNNTCMTYHIRVCKVYKNKSVFRIFNCFQNIFTNSRSTHFRLQVISCNFWRWNQCSCFVRLSFINTAIKEECNVSIFFCFSCSELVNFVSFQNITQNIN